MIVAVTDRKACEGSFLQQIERICDIGIDMLILREKDMEPEDYQRLAISCKDICKAHNVLFCVNSFIGVSKEIKADLVQIPMGALKEGIPCGMGYGVSVHTIDEVYAVNGSNASFVIFGNVFETDSKPGLIGKGLDMLGEVCNASKVPVLAIGGIDSKNCRSVMGTGASGICARGLFMRGDLSEAIDLIGSIKSELKGFKPI